jgi:WD40 repeat protein
MDEQAQEQLQNEQLQNPFPGLRSFEAAETHLFFGREGQSDEILKILAHDRFVAVVGTSGAGKSSLVRAGMIPSLEAGYMAAAGSSWRFAVLRPGDQQDPIASLAHRLADPEVFGAIEIDTEALTRILDTTLRRSSFGLIEAARQLHLQPGENLLVLVDQFEELFRLRNSRVRSAAEDVEAAFVRLLLEAARQTELPIYVVITMRSDFIGDCAEFRDLPEALNRAQFLIPRMTRDQRHQAIEGPIAVSGATITSRLAQRMLNEVGDNPDQLPILQHALMRTWDAWYRAGKLNDPIDLDHYQSIGGWENALSLHADEAFNELDAAEKEVAQKVFKALVERGPDNRETRRPGPISLLSAIANTSETAVRNVIDHFRLPGRTFLMPPAEVALSSDSIIDISHESLIRLWRRLRNWVAEEADSAVIYKRLADAAQRHKQGRAGLWRDPDLRIALEWKQKTHPNAPWAERYAPGFEDAVEFLELSHQDQLTDRAAREAAERLLRFRLNLLRVVAAVLVILTFIAVRFALNSRREKEVAQREKAVAQIAEQAALARELRTTAYQTRDESPEISALLAIEAARTMLALNKYSKSTDGILREALRIVKPAASYPVLSTTHRNEGCHSKPVTISNRGRISRVLSTPASDKMDFAPIGESFVAVCESDHDSKNDAKNDPKKDSKSEPAPVAAVVDQHGGQQVIALEGSSQDTTVAFTPDGSYVAAGGEDGTVSLLNAKTGRSVWKHTVGGPVAALTVSSTGRWIAVGFGEVTNHDASSGQSGKDMSTGGLAILNVEDGSARPSPELHGWVVDSDFSPDGKMVAAANWNGEAVLFNPDTGQELVPRVRRSFPFQGRQPPYNSSSVTFSDDGRYLAFGFSASDLRVGSGIVVVYDTTTLKQIGRDISVSGEVTATSFTPARSLSQPGQVPALAVLSRQDVWIEDFDPAAMTWGPRKGISIRNNTSTNRAATTIYSDALFTPDGEYLVIADNGGYIRFYDPASEDQVLYRRFANLGELTGLKFNSNGEFLAAIGTQRTEVFDVKRDLLASRNLKLAGASPTAKGPAAFDRDFSTAVVPADDGSELVFKLDDKGQFQSHKLQQSTAEASTVATNRVNDQASTGAPSSSAPAAADMQPGNSSVKSVAISADGAVIAMSDGAKIEVQDSAAGKELWKIEGDGEGLAFSPDGQWLAAAEKDQGVHLFHASSGLPGWVSKEQVGNGPSLAFSPSSRWIAVGSDRGLFVADVTNGDFSQVENIRDVSALAFSADEKKLAIAAGDGSGFLVNPGAKASDFSVSSSFKIIAPGFRVENLQFSLDGRYLMAHDSANMVHLFDPANPNVEITNLTGSNTVFAAQFDDASKTDPKLLIAVSNPDSISVVRTNSRVFVDPIRVIDEVCDSLNRNLDCKEWRNYLPDEPYRQTCKNLPMPEGAPECKRPGTAAQSAPTL